jgi:hypothetical protein
VITVIVPFGELSSEEAAAAELDELDEAEPAAAVEELLLPQPARAPTVIAPASAIANNLLLCFILSSSKVFLFYLCIKYRF